MLAQKPAPILTSADLLPGDILMHHVHKNTQQWLPEPFHCSIVGANSDAWDSMPQDGVRFKRLYVFVDGAAVFRPTDPPTIALNIPDQAAVRASQMKGAGYGDKVLGTDKWRAATSFVGSIGSTGEFGTAALKRLTKYHTRHLPRNVFCSEYVILCYQLACLDKGLNQHAGFFPNRDARFTMPSDLEAYLQLQNAHWNLQGAFPN